MQAMAPEDRNGRGLIVLLIGREIETEADVNFLKEVLKEKPCLSLQDCKIPQSPEALKDAHGSAGVGPTLAYPQLVDLFQIEKFLNENSDPKKAAYKESLIAALKETANSPDPTLAKKAKEILNGLKGH